ncbi:hypothetical protein CLV59_10618 [Chitinophaga dinghuensis]|uniref:Uncharacterized protein n=1 Tax=Chitinophaga dinghuensis TaxID=1539050 RepID=A0A327W227_9BACT|nr:hypothetical protein [Chitinophaga dinghuensis]RAJ78958.1 hypothetical protein CLV59_10618 [Chitinophaga dinghuensis]
MNELLLNTIVDKLNIIEQTITQLNNITPQMPDHSGDIKKLTTQISEVKTAISCMPELLKFPVVAVDRLIKNIEQNNSLLKNPPAKEVRHYHHITAPIVVAGVLFLLLVLCTAWLYSSRSTLNEYQAADFKYRFMKMQADKGLRAFIVSTDSLYNSNMPAFQDIVIKWEAERQRVAALLLEAQEKEQEANQLREKAGRSK